MKQITKSLFIWLAVLLMLGQVTGVFAQQILISPQPLYFGNTPDDTDTYRYMVIRNVSSETLDISQISIEGANAGEFSVGDNPGSLNLSGFGRSELTINFHPQSPGLKEAQIVFQSNAASSPDKIDLTGYGTSVSGVITFEKILGTIEGDGASDVRPTADGGFIICGNTDNVDEESNDAYLVKTNTYGEVEWTEVYDSDDNDENSDGFSSVIPLEDGYIAVGNTYNGSRDLDLWIVKTDLNGVQQWDILFGDTDNDGARQIEKTNDGNFIIVGYTFDPEGVSGRDGYLIKIDGEGNTLWSKIFGDSDSENLGTIRETDDNGFILAGTISTGGTGSDMLLIKTDASGNVSWQKQYGNSGEENVDGAGTVIETADGGYLVAGSTTSFGAGARDVYVIKTDASGNQDASWGGVEAGNLTFGAEHHDGASEVVATSDGGYLVVGSTENHYEEAPNEWYSDIYIIKLDKDGIFKWDNIYGGLRNEGASMARQLEDGSIIISGRTSSYGSNGDQDIYFLRITSNGNLITAIEKSVTSLPAKMQLAQNYPNPFNGQTTITYSLSKNTDVSLKVYDITGRFMQTLVNSFQQAGEYKLTLNASNLASGLYIYRLSTGGFSETKRLLLIK